MKCPVLSSPISMLHGDSRTMLDCVKPGSADLVFTSPPYYNAKEYSHWPTYEAYLNDMQTVIEKSKVALKGGHYMVINISPVIIPRTKRNDTSKRIPLHFHMANILESAGMEFVDDIIWEKPVSSVGNKRGLNFFMYKTPMIYRPYPTNEHILVYKKPNGKTVTSAILKKPRALRMASKVMELVDTGETWHINPTRSKDHPAPFPDELADRVVKLYSFKEDVVLDPFSGSGTTCVVSKKLDRKCIGIEKKKQYTKMDAADRARKCC